MAQGMAYPVRPNKRGGAQLIQGGNYLETIIKIGLTPNTSKNPFQRGQGVDIGIPETIIFKLNHQLSRSIARRGIRRFFARLKALDLAKLKSGAGGVVISHHNEELVANVNYIDLEADRERTVRTNLLDALRPISSVNISGR